MTAVASLPRDRPRRSPAPNTAAPPRIWQSGWRRTLFDEVVVVGDEPLAALFVGHVAELGEALEVALARRAGSEQHQDRGGLVGLVAEAVNAAGWDVEV